MPYKDPLEKKESDRLYRMTEKGKLARQNSHRKWYMNNKALAIKRATDYEERLKKENPEKYLSSRASRMRKYQATPKGFYRTIQFNARKRSIPVEMTQFEFIEWYNKQEKVCRYCLLKDLSKLVMIGGRKRFSIDRMDNSKGYLLDNICLCCLVCNQVKSNLFSYSEMVKIGKVIKNIWKSKTQE